MNEFLFYLWMADVTKALDFVTSLAMLASFLCIMAILLYNILEDTEKKIPTKAWVVFIVSTTICVLLPSKQTMYVAAAGQATQQFSQTEAGKKLITAFEKKVDDYIAGEKK